MSILTDFLTYPFLFKALLSTVGLSILCGLLSPMVVAKKFAFMGASISHGALLGVAISLSFLDGGTTAHSAGIFFITLLVTIIAASPLAYSTFRQRLPSDALIGLFFTATMGLGLLIHQAQGASTGDLLSFLFGNILTIDYFDLGLLAVLIVIITPVILLFKNQWMLFIFDEEAAAIQGLSSFRYHLSLFLMLTLIIVAGLKVSGVILINSFLLVPGIYALKFAPNASSTFRYAILFSTFTSLTALILANSFDLPTGATIAVTQVATYILSIVMYRK